MLSCFPSVSCSNNNLVSNYQQNFNAKMSIFNNQNSEPQAFNRAIRIHSFQGNDSDPRVGDYVLQPSSTLDERIFMKDGLFEIRFCKSELCKGWDSTSLFVAPTYNDKSCLTMSLGWTQADIDLKEFFARQYIIIDPLIYNSEMDAFEYAHDATHSYETFTGITEIMNNQKLSSSDGNSTTGKTKPSDSTAAANDATTHSTPAIDNNSGTKLLGQEVIFGGGRNSSPSEVVYDSPSTDHEDEDHDEDVEFGDYASANIQNQAEESNHDSTNYEYSNQNASADSSLQSSSNPPASSSGSTLLDSVVSAYNAVSSCAGATGSTNNLKNGEKTADDAGNTGSGYYFGAKNNQQITDLNSSASRKRKICRSTTSHSVTELPNEDFEVLFDEDWLVLPDEEDPAAKGRFASCTAREATKYAVELEKSARENRMASKMDPWRAKMTRAIVAKLQLEIEDKTKQLKTSLEIDFRNWLLSGDRGSVQRFIEPVYQQNAALSRKDKKDENMLDSMYLGSVGQDVVEDATSFTRPLVETQTGGFDLVKDLLALRSGVCQRLEQLGYSVSQSEQGHGVVVSWD